LLGANVIIKLDIGSGYGAKSGKIITFAIDGRES
jgi:hypothetical protein